jgi:hypothetical protein
MARWWEIPLAEQSPVPKVRAVAYYRHSAHNRQENSIPIQKAQVHKWARDYDVEIIHEFTDAGISGLTADITLGVLLSDAKELEILGYLAMPRSEAGEKAFRLSSGSSRIDMFGRTDLTFLQQLL